MVGEQPLCGQDDRRRYEVPYRKSACSLEQAEAPGSCNRLCQWGGRSTDFSGGVGHIGQRHRCNGGRLVQGPPGKGNAIQFGNGFGKM